MNEPKTYRVTTGDGKVTFKLAERYIWMPKIATGKDKTVEFILYGKASFVDNVKQIEQIHQ